MNREDIIRMAREIWSAGEVYIGPSEKNLERFAALVAAAEREAYAGTVIRVLELVKQQLIQESIDREDNE